MRIFLATLLTLLAFAGGLAGAFYAMPAVAPYRVAEAQARIDSLRADSALAGFFPALPPSYSPVADSLAAAIHTSPWSDSLATDADSGRVYPVFEAILAAYRDSLGSARQSLDSLRRGADRLHGVIASLHQQHADEVAAQQTQKADVMELSKTVARLEDKPLAGLVAQLDEAVLAALYQEATPRNRIRLLQALPVDEAARFVDRLVRPGAVTEADLLPDSLAVPQAAGEDTAALDR